MWLENDFPPEFRRKLRRPWVLFLIAVVGIGFYCLWHFVLRPREQLRALTAELEQAGGSYTHDWCDGWGELDLSGCERGEIAYFLTRYAPFEVDELLLEECTLAAHDFTHLARFPELKILSLRDVTLQGNGLSLLRNVDSLQEVRLSGAEIELGLKSLKDLPQIHRVELSGGQLTEESVEYFNASNVTCLEFEPVWTTGFTIGRALPKINALSKVKILKLNDCLFIWRPLIDAILEANPDMMVTCTFEKFRGKDFVP